MNVFLKAVTAFFFLCILSLNALAVGSTISGRVVEKSSSEPVGWATVALMKPDSTIVTGVACDDKGVFKFSVAPGKYIFKVSMMGYVDDVKNLEIKAGVNELGDIALSPDNQMLAAARVTEREKLIEIKIDKIVMNVAQSAFAQGSNGLELLQKAPGVVLDKDGNVKLNGKSVAVWIDGRPSHLTGKSLESLLRSTNGESIEKFEIMEHPSAKYDAAGQGGIINIKTKKNFLQGLNGSMGLGFGGMWYPEKSSFPFQQSFWVNLAYRTKKANTFFSLYEGFYSNHMNFENTLIGTDLLQQTTSYLPMLFHNYNVKVGNDWFLDKKNTLGFIIYVPGDYQKIDAPSTGFVEVQNMRTHEISSDLRNMNKSTQYSANLNFTHIFDEQLSSEMTMNFDYFRNMGKDDNRQTDTTVFLNSAQSSGDVAEKSIKADNKYDIWSAKVDYQTILFKKFMFESGAKWALSKTDNYSVERRTSVPDSVSNFIYRETIGAVYATMAGQLGPKWTLKAGIRGEYTYSSGDWMSAGKTSKRDYFDIFPTVYLGFNPSEKWRFSFSYSRRINRPDYSQLNPTKTFIDSRTYVVGNPNVLPEYSNDLSITSGFGQHLSLSLGYSACNDALNQRPGYEEGISILTWDNYGTNKVAYASFNVAALPVTKWLQWTLSANLVNIKSTVRDTDIKKDYTFPQAYTSFSFLIPKSWRIDLDGRYSGPMVVGSFKIYENFVSNIAAKKTLLDGKMTLTIKLNDIFRSSQMNLDILDDYGNGLESRIRQKFYEQKLMLDITWNFGKAQQARRRKVGNLEEASRAGRSGLGNN